MAYFMTLKKDRQPIHGDRVEWCPPAIVSVKHWQALQWSFQHARLQQASQLGNLSSRPSTLRTRVRPTRRPPSTSELATRPPRSA